MIDVGERRRAMLGGALLVLGAIGAGAQRGDAQPISAHAVGRSQPAPRPTAWSDEIYRLGRESLAKASFETAVRLFRILETEPAWERNASYVFNRAQASRYAGNAGEAVYWYGRYLALEPTASDARSVAEQIAHLVQASPKDVRATALERARSDYTRLREDPELSRALDEAPRVRLEVRFTRVASSPGVPPQGPADAQSTAFVFPARAVYWTPPEAEAPESDWQAWIAPTAPVAVPEDLNAPPLLFLPPGRPFPVAMSSDLVSRPTLLRVPPAPFFPADPELDAWRIEVVAMVLKTGPPLLVSARQVGFQMADVRSGPSEGPLVLGRKRREAPREATAISFGPRLPRPDSKTFARLQIAVLDFPGKDGAVERWGAPIGRLDVVNRFGRLGPGPDGELRMNVRATDEGPYLIPLK